MREPIAKAGPDLTLPRALVTGGLGFTVVSVAGFSLWAFAGRWFYSTVGEAGLYAASTVVFLGLSGLLLHPLVVGERKVVRFYKIFVPAFLLYAVAWCAFWFGLGFGAGEWLGSFAGCAVFCLVLAKAFNNRRAFPMSLAILFLVHTAGYFAGDFAMKHLKPGAFAALEGLSRQTISTLGKLAWGVCYGMGFGLGIGWVFFAMQRTHSRIRPRDTDAR